MNQQQQESLSALVDGETTEFETRRVLNEMDGESREQWARYQLISEAMSNQLNTSTLNINIADAVAAEIAEEPALNVAEEPAASSKAKVSWFKPAAGFAIAASVAFVAVLGIQQPEVINNGFIANGNVSASQLQISGGLGLNQASAVASLPLASEIDDIDAQKKREQARLNYYLQQHAEHASFNNGRGLLPMARMTKEAY